MVKDWLVVKLGTSHNMHLVVKALTPKDALTAVRSSQWTGLENGETQSLLAFYGEYVDQEKNMTRVRNLLQHYLPDPEVLTEFGTIAPIHADY